jgi:hypothetical protein
MEDGIKKISRTISGERAASTVGAVRAGGQSDNQDSGIGVSEGRNRAAPIAEFAIRATLFRGDLRCVLAEARTEFAGGDAGVERGESSRSSCGRFLHLNDFIEEDGREECALPAPFGVKLARLCFLRMLSGSFRKLCCFKNS